MSQQYKNIMVFQSASEGLKVAVLCSEEEFNRALALVGTGIDLRWPSKVKGKCAKDMVEAVLL